MRRRALLAGAMLSLALPAFLALPGTAGAAAFSNSTPIGIPAFGNASPYPSVISVSGLKGTVAEVGATLTGISHDEGSDISALLVAPSGKSVLLMENRCASLVNATFAFSYFAPAQLPPLAASCPSGSYRPAGGTPQTVPPGASAPRGGQLSLFNGGTANGPWKLFVSDTRSGDAGTIAGGWSLRIATRPVKCKKGKRRNKKTGKCVRKKKRRQ